MRACVRVRLCVHMRVRLRVRVHVRVRACVRAHGVRMCAAGALAHWQAAHSHPSGVCNATETYEHEEWIQPQYENAPISLFSEKDAPAPVRADVVFLYRARVASAHSEQALALNSRCAKLSKCE